MRVKNDLVRHILQLKITRVTVFASKVLKFGSYFGKLYFENKFVITHV